MTNEPDNRMFPPKYQKLWPQAVKAFALEEAAAEAYTADPTPERLTALQDARRAYNLACHIDRVDQIQAKVYREELETATIERQKPDFPIASRQRGARCG